MSEILETLEFFGANYVATLGIAMLCSYLGLFTVMRRIVFTGVALAQLAAAGVALSFFVADATWIGQSIRQFAKQYGAATGSLGLSLLGALGLQVRPHRNRSSPDAFVGLVYALASAAAILLVWRSSSGLVELRNILAGDVLLTETSELFFLWFGIVAVAVLHMVYRRQFLLCSYDPEFARVLGLPERRYQIMLLASLAVAVALALRASGLLLVFAFLVVPPLTGLAIGRRLGDSTRIAMASAMGSSLIGFVLAIGENLPVAPTIAVSMIAMLGLAKLSSFRAGLAKLTAWLIYASAIAALVTAFLVFPWPNLDESQAGAGAAGHAHGGGTGRAGPSLSELRQAAVAELVGSPDVEIRLKAALKLRTPQYQEIGSIRPFLGALQDDDARVQTEVLLGLKELSGLYRGRAMLQTIAAQYEEPETAFAAARVLAVLGDLEGLGHMVAMLGNEDFPLMSREELLEFLQTPSGGKDFGYDAFADPDENRKAIAAWKTWWDQARKGGLRWDAAAALFYPMNS